jgi:signal transduction histidine kinase
VANFVDAPTPEDDLGAGSGSVECSQVSVSRLGVAIEHALRAPLSGAASAARLLADQVHDPHAGAARSIVDAIEHAEDMLTDVAEFLRRDVDLYPRVVRRRTNLSSLCERALDSIQFRFPSQLMKFNCDRSVEGQWDPDAIAAMTSRLVLNAIQHGTIGTAVRLFVSGRDDKAFIEIWNAGAFPAAVLADRLFEPFVFTRTRRSGGWRGLGLGLCLACRVARAHGGRIEIQSDVRKGTTLRVVLPCV